MIVGKLHGTGGKARIGLPTLLFKYLTSPTAQVAYLMEKQET